MPRDPPLMNHTPGLSSNTRVKTGRHTNDATPTAARAGTEPDPASGSRDNSDFAFQRCGHGSQPAVSLSPPLPGGVTCHAYPVVAVVPRWSGKRAGLSHTFWKRLSAKHADWISACITRRRPTRTRGL